MSVDNKKKVFLIISGDQQRIDLISAHINQHYYQPNIYSAPTGNIGFMKIKNAQIDIVITDTEHNTADAIKLVDAILIEKLNPHMAIIILGHPPEQEKFLDELAIGRLYFIESEIDDNEFAYTLAKALNFTSHTETAAFHLRYLAEGDVLIKEGEVADFVYILKNGQLRAYITINNNKITLGNIEVGEFVGEMSYINNERRSASIEAMTDAQLIEIPIGHVDKILYKRPAWSKALMNTLSKRIKIANKSKTGIQ